MMSKKLLVIVADRISDLVKKGEYTVRYYNPGNLFDEVHVLMTNDDQPDRIPLQRTVGRAQLHLHNLPVPSFLHSLGWRTPSFRRWVGTGIELARQIGPALIRVHGNFQNGYLAAQIRKELGVPLAVSLHINPDADMRERTPWQGDWKGHLVHRRMLWFERETLQTADRVLPVYEPIRPYAERLGAKQIEVCYNALNGDHLRKKESYRLSARPRIISVGRQFKEKNADQLIRAVARLKEAELTLVGDGPLHDHLKQVARECQIPDRVVFYRAVPNDELCKMLPEFDLFATHSEYWELNKCVLEALLTGLPVVLNQRNGPAVPELQGDFLLLVENSPDGYYYSIKRILQDDRFREDLGRKAYRHARERWAPETAEAKFVKVYEELMQGR
jgi:glycosyltransferase involved in cell wall biosynthesis